MTKEQAKNIFLHWKKYGKHFLLKNLVNKDAIWDELVSAINVVLEDWKEKNEM